MNSSELSVARIAADENRRWWALVLLCMGVLMVAINATIVSVALSAIRLELAFADTSLVWIVNAHLATFGGFLLLGARLGDLYGPRKTFLLGIATFTLAALACGLSTTPAMLIASRAVQGAGGAVISATALAQIAALFEDGPNRAKALGAYIFVSAGGGSIGLLLGGVLMSSFTWPWIFLANVPVGLCVYALCTVLLPADAARTARERADVPGALTVTASLILALCAIANSQQLGWASLQTLASLLVAAVTLIAFLLIEARAPAPLVPLSVFRERNLTVASLIAVPLAAAVLAWRYISALYLQLVLQLDPLQVALAFLPANVLSALVSFVGCPQLVTHFGTRRPFAAGMVLTGIGLALLGQAPVRADVALEVLPGMLLVGLGTSMAYNPLYVSAMNCADSRTSGIASGILNTSLSMGGVVGLSALATLAAARTEQLLASGTAIRSALSSGYRLALFGAAILAIVAALAGALFMHREQRTVDASKTTPTVQ
jgi:MFS family permease